MHWIDSEYRTIDLRVIEKFAQNSRFSSSKLTFRIKHYCWNIYENAFIECVFMGMYILYC